MEKQAIDRKLTSYILTSSTVATTRTVPVDQATMLPAAEAGEETIDRLWVELEGRNAPKFAKRFPVRFSPGDVVHVLQMDHGVTAKPNRPALIINETTGEEHVERLSPPQIGVIGFVFGPVGAWLIAVVAAWIAAAKADDFGLGHDATIALGVLAAILAVIWGVRCVTEAAYLVRSRKRVAEEASAVAEARRLISDGVADA